MKSYRCTIGRIGQKQKKNAYDPKQATRLSTVDKENLCTGNAYRQDRDIFLLYDVLLIQQASIINFLRTNETIWLDSSLLSSTTVYALWKSGKQMPYQQHTRDICRVGTALKALTAVVIFVPFSAMLQCINRKLSWWRCFASRALLVRDQ